MSESWEEIAVNNLRAAHELRRLGQYRSAVSRAYYAVFAAATYKLSKAKVKFPKGWVAPHHDQLPGLVKNNLRGLSERVRRRAVHSIRGLYIARIGADYRPTMRFENADVHQLLMDARTTLNDFEVQL